MDIDKILLQSIADEIEQEAQTRLDLDSSCQGGLRAKIHSVWMDLALILKDRMVEK